MNYKINPKSIEDTNEEYLLKINNSINNIKNGNFKELDLSESDLEKLLEINSNKLLSHKTSSHLLEYRLITLFHINSLTLTAYNLTKKELSSEISNHIIEIIHSLLNLQIHNENFICAIFIQNLVKNNNSKYTYNYIYENFNKQIADIVMSMTKK